jgi:hypothetical protein
MNNLVKNIFLWIIIALVMLVIFSRYMPSAAPSSLSAQLKFNRVARAPQICLTTSAGQVVCPPPNGSIGADAAGQAVCGRGECLKDSAGRWMCSIEVGGHVGQGATGQAVCTGGCEQASAMLCERAK